MSIFYGTNTFILAPDRSRGSFYHIVQASPSALHNLRLVVDKKTSTTMYPIESIQIQLSFTRMTKIEEIMDVTLDHNSGVSTYLPPAWQPPRTPRTQITSTVVGTSFEAAAEFREIIRLVAANFPNVRYVEIQMTVQIRDLPWWPPAPDNFHLGYGILVEALGTLLSIESVKEVWMDMMQLDDDGCLWLSLLEANNGVCEKLKVEGIDFKEERM